jgi:MIP family channel proteins
MDRYLRPSLAELIGTFAFVFLGAGTVCTAQLVEGQTPATLALSVALAEGFILAALLAATLPVSGGFLNPAVTLMLWVFRRIEGQAACWLIVAQFLGAVLAGLVLRLMFTEAALFPGAGGGPGITPHLNRPAFEVGGEVKPLAVLLSGIGVEVVLTFILTFAIFGTVLDPRAPRLGGLGVGLALSAAVLMGYTLTGAALNPARWFGPALWELTVPGRDAFRDHTVYWIGPVFGALLAGGFYEYFILGSPDSRAPVETPPAGSPPVISTLYRGKK